MLLIEYPNSEIRASVSKRHLHRVDPPPPNPYIVYEAPDSWEPIASLEPDFEESESRFLDIPPVLSGQPKPRRSMGADARRQALRLGALFAPAVEQRTLLLTGTLPGSTRAARRVFAENSSRMVKLLQDSIRSWCRIRAVTDWKYLWVWELQKRGALHWHCVLELPTSELASEFADYWHQCWVTNLQNIGVNNPEIFDRKGGGSWIDEPDVWQTDAQITEKDTGRYVSKYLSKDMHSKSDVPLEYCPHGRWWGCSRALRDELVDFIAKHSYYLPIEVAPGEDMEMVGEVLKSLIESYSNGTARDVSPWFQDHTKAAFGFLKEGVEMMRDFLPAVVEAFSFIANQWAFNEPMSWGYRFELESAMNTSRGNPDRRESVAWVDGLQSAMLLRPPSAPPWGGGRPAASSFQKSGFDDIPIGINT